MLKTIIFLLIFCFTSVVLFSNADVIDLESKYRLLNEKAERSIEANSQQDIISETRIIAPKVSNIHKDLRAALLSKSFTKLELQDVIVNKISRVGMLPSMVGYHDFPVAVGISVNEELIHNLPDETSIDPGSLVTIELGGSTYKAYASQTWSFLIPPVSDEKLRILNIANQALRNAVELVAPGVRTGDIGHVIQNTVEEAGYNVVREYCGYTMGKKRIMDPQITTYGRPNTGTALEKDQIINIHVLITDGSGDIRLHPNRWGVKINSGKLSVALSMMVLVTEDGHEVLTPEI